MKNLFDQTSGNKPIGLLPNEAHMPRLPPMRVGASASRLQATSELSPKATEGVQRARTPMLTILSSAKPYTSAGSFRLLPAAKSTSLPEGGLAYAVSLPMVTKV